MKEVQELRVTNSVFSFYINALSFLIFSYLYRLVKAFVHFPLALSGQTEA